MDNYYSRMVEGMIAEGMVYGTIVRHPINMQLYWSPLEWHSPKVALDIQPDMWLCLGTEHWWGSQEQKKLFEALRLLVDSFPSWPGEYDYYPRHCVTQ